MTYFAVAVITLPVAVSGAFGVFKSRHMVKRFMDDRRERRFAAMADTGPAPLPDYHHDLRFTQSLLALSKVRSPEHDGFPVPEPDEASSLVLIRHAQSKTPDPAA